MKKIVVIGSGAREHAIVRALIRGASLPGAAAREIVAIPGNPGIARECRCVSSPGAVELLAKATILEKPDLVIVGPEAPLAAGLADRLIAEGIAVFGPTAAAAQIEASKSFAKDVMRAANVPIAEGTLFEVRERALSFAKSAGACVVKLDGLAAGKGVIVCDDSEQAVAAVNELWSLATAPGSILEARTRLLIEERLSGPEISVIGLVDGETILVLPPARDHKRLLEGDRGPNTGGMGAVSPPKAGTQALLDEVLERVLTPTVREMAKRGVPFRGALFAGLMLTPGGIRVLEFNCRLGDPEAQAILMRVRNDVLPLFEACANGTLLGHSLDVDPRVAVAVVLAAHGYPAAPRAGDPISGLDALDGLHSNDLAIFHAGTRASGDQIVTSGGRVLSLCALGDTVGDARAKAFALAEKVTFPGRQLRRDLAAAEE
jgi:phosphoribosylamine--glycine ligase